MKSRKNRVLYTKLVASSEAPAIVRWLLRHKIVSSEGRAVLLVCLAILIFFGLSYFFFMRIFPARHGSFIGVTPQNYAEASYRSAYLKP